MFRVLLLVRKLAVRAKTVVDGAQHEGGRGALGSSVIHDRLPAMVRKTSFAGGMWRVGNQPVLASACGSGYITRVLFLPCC